MLKGCTRKLDITYLMDVKRILEVSLINNKFESYYARKNNELGKQALIDENIKRIKATLQEVNLKIKMADIPCISSEEISLYLIDDKPLDYSIKLSSTGETIGKIDYRGYHYDRKLGDIGYRIDEKYRGNNYAFKALCLMGKLLEEKGVKDFWISARPDNLASRRIIEKFGGEIIECSDEVFLYCCDTKPNIHKRVNTQD